MLTTHDTYCRCRLCKPPLPGEEQHQRERYAAVAIIILAIVAAIIAISS